MDAQLLEQLEQRIDSLLSQRAELRAEVEKLRAAAGGRSQELEAELSQVRAEADAARADLDAARREVQERESRIQTATARVQSLIERLRQD